MRTGPVAQTQRIGTGITPGQRTGNAWPPLCLVWTRGRLDQWHGTDGDRNCATRGPVRRGSDCRLSWRCGAESLSHRGVGTTPLSSRSNESLAMPQPQYILTPRPVGRLARGELAIEPALGPVRVAAAWPCADDDGTDFIHVRWCDERGPTTASARYPADRALPVRMPGYRDRLRIRRDLDQARWWSREISATTAQLIAAHLHPAEASALHRFAFDGRIADELYDELEVVIRHRRYARDWVHALARYCLAQAVTGPMAASRRKAMAEAEARAEAWLTAAGATSRVPDQSTAARHRRSGRFLDLLARRHMSTDTAVQLIDAAFEIGLAAGHRRTLPALARQRLDHFIHTS
jgi:hypothetical protein